MKRVSSDKLLIRNESGQLVQLPSLKGEDIQVVDDESKILPSSKMAIVSKEDDETIQVAEISDIPTKVSELENDSSFTTPTDVVNKVTETVTTEYINSTIGYTPADSDTVSELSDNMSRTMKRVNIATTGTQNAIKITPSVNYQAYLIYGQGGTLIALNAMNGNNPQFTGSTQQIKVVNRDIYINVGTNKSLFITSELAITVSAVEYNDWTNLATRSDNLALKSDIKPTSVSHIINGSRCGNIMSVYTTLNDLVASDTTVFLGNTNLLPNNTYAVLPVYKYGLPYDVIGSCWISKNSGAVTVYKPTSVTSCYIAGTYILA